MKLKTHKGAAKRFKITATGKVKRRHSFARHILTKKAAGRKRKLSKATIRDCDADTPKIKRMLPYAYADRSNELRSYTVPRVKRGTKRHNRRKKLLSLAKGLLPQ